MKTQSPPKAMVAAVVYSHQTEGYLVGYNRRSNRYSLPMRRLPPTEPNDRVARHHICEDAAIQAVEKTLHRMLPDDATATWVEYLEVERVSSRTGQLIPCTYHIVTVDPKTEIPVGHLGGESGLMTYRAILKSTLVGPSTQAILQKLLTDQHVALAVISRRRQHEREYLMTSASKGQFFFVARRQREFDTPQEALMTELRLTVGYHGPVEIHEVCSAPVRQRTAHLGERSYVFHVFRALFPGADLHCDTNPLTAALGKSRLGYKWCTEHDLLHPGNNLSSTVKGLSHAILSIPD